MNTNTPSTKALSRTWETVTTYTACGENWGTSTYTVTLSRAVIGGELSATINGQACEVSRAVRLLQNADTVTKLTEVLPTESAIGSERAHGLHRLMGLCEIENHYSAASYGAHRPVESLASLTVTEFARVIAHLYQRCADAPQYAAEVANYLERRAVRSAVAA